MENLLLVITNEIFRQGKVPETLKVGLLTPIFKNKGLKSQVTNNRGITVLPVISKIVETIIKERIQKQVIETQNRKQKRIYQWFVTNKFSPTSGGMLPRGRRE